MRINNVYQRRTISIPKIVLILGFIIIVIIFAIWRLYYERLQTGTVDTFAEFVGLDGLAGKDKDLIKDLEQSFMINIDEYIDKKENASYIPQFTEQSMNNIDKIYNLSEGETKKAYLTFDDGPSKDVTPLILDILKEEKITATFFVLGTKVEENPDILKRIYEEGHYIANHGYSHIYSQIYANTDAVLEEYNKCENAIRNALGISSYSTHLFRFPSGSSGGIYDDIKKESLKKFEENKVAILDWNCLTKDSEGSYSKETLIEYFKQTSSGKNNLVILMHDAGGKILVPDVLKEVIKLLKNDGYAFGNMREVVG